MKGIKKCIKVTVLGFLRKILIMPKVGIFYYVFPKLYLMAVINELVKVTDFESFESLVLNCIS